MQVEDLTAQTIRTVIGKHVVLDSTLNIDEAQRYKALGKKSAEHEAVNHGGGEHVRGDVTIDTIAGFFGAFERGMTGVYQHCGEAHLQAYLKKFDFRYGNRIKLGVDDIERTRRAIKGAEGKRLTSR